MTVAELIALLKPYPGDSLIVFEDCTVEDDMSYERFEANANDDGEVVLRLV